VPDASIAFAALILMALKAGGRPPTRPRARLAASAVRISLAHILVLPEGGKAGRSRGSARASSVGGGLLPVAEQFGGLSAVIICSPISATRDPGVAHGSERHADHVYEDCDIVCLRGKRPLQHTNDAVAQRITIETRIG
jgi:hypothetical protein